jgi:hypothetical protein
MEDLEKLSISERYPATTPEEKKSRYEEVLNRFLSMDPASYYWIGKSSIRLNNKEFATTILLRFYDGANVSKHNDLGSMSDPANFCWIISIFVPDFSKHWAGSSSCAGSVRKKNDQYYLVPPLQMDEIEPVYTHVAVELPFSHISNADIELLDSTTQKWVKAPDSLNWAPATSQVAEQLERELKGDSTSR